MPQGSTWPQKGKDSYERAKRLQNTTKKRENLERQKGAKMGAQKGKRWESPEGKKRKDPETGTSALFLGHDEWF